MAEKGDRLAEMVADYNHHQYGHPQLFRAIRKRRDLLEEKLEEFCSEMDAILEEMVEELEEEESEENEDDYS